MCTKQWTYPCQHFTRIEHFDGCLCKAIFQFDNVDICAKCDVDIQQEETESAQYVVNPDPTCQTTHRPRKRKSHGCNSPKIEMCEHDAMQAVQRRHMPLAAPRTSNFDQKPQQRERSSKVDLASLTQKLQDVIYLGEKDVKPNKGSNNSHLSPANPQKPDQDNLKK